MSIYKDFLFDFPYDITMTKICIQAIRIKLQIKVKV